MRLTSHTVALKTKHGRRAVIPGLILTAVAVASAFFACDGPEQNIKGWGWRQVFVFEENGGHIFLADLLETGDVVYICGSVKAAGGDAKAAVYRYRDNKMDAVFISPYEESDFDAIDYDGNAGFAIYAAGSKKENGNNRPYVVMFDGSNWTEIAVPAFVKGPGFREAAVAGPFGYWANNGLYVYSYRDGEWRERLRTNYPPFFLTWLAASNDGHIYICREDYEEDIVILVSDNGGASWAEERPEINGGAYHCDYITAAKGGPYGYFLTAKLGNNARHHEMEYFGVITRAPASAGSGVFELAYMAPRGPRIYDLSALAFRSENEGYATGSLTSVKRDRGQWYQETVPAFTPAFEAISAGSSGYWAVSNDGDGNPPALWLAE